MEELLDQPEEIWRYAFERQISPGARNLLLCLQSLTSSSLKDTENAWHSLHAHRAKKYGFETTPHDFRNALHELDGSFIILSTSYIRLLNPSIRDFIENLFRTNAEYVCDVVASATRFNHIGHLWALAKEKPSETLAAALMTDIGALVSSLKRVLCGTYFSFSQNPKNFTGFIDVSPEGQLNLLVDWAEATKSLQILGLAAMVVDYLTAVGQSHRLTGSSTIGCLEVLDGAPWVQQHNGSELRRKLLDGILNDMLTASAHTWEALLRYKKQCVMWTINDEAAVDKALKEFQTKGIFYEIQGCDSVDQLEGLSTSLTDIETEFGIKFADAISQIEDDISERGGSADANDSGGIKPEIQKVTKDLTTDAEIRHMFRSLIA